MESRITSMGHPVHPMLVSYPLGLLTTSVLFDVVHLILPHGAWSEVAYWMIVAGVVSGVLAAVVGLLDFLAIPGETRAKRIGVLHGIGATLVLLAFGVSWLLRANSVSLADPSIIALVFSFLGVALIGGVGWLGGELHGHLGVGINPEANLNAPSSLRKSSASEQAAN
jgi:uncharacterized membrane protein